MFDEKYKNLMIEIEDFREKYEKKRKFYDQRVRICNTTSSLLTPITAGLIFVSLFWETYETWLKGIGVVCCIASIGINHIAKNQNYGAKLIQRGTTYFALCNLSRKMRLAVDAESKYEEFAKEFQGIMENDNQMSLSNSLVVVDLLNKNYAKSLEQEKQIKAQEDIK